MTDLFRRRARSSRVVPGAAEVRHRYGGPLTRHAKEGTTSRLPRTWRPSRRSGNAGQAPARTMRWSVKRLAGPGRGATVGSGWSTRCAVPVTTPPGRRWSPSTWQCAPAVGYSAAPAPTLQRRGVLDRRQRAAWVRVDGTDTPLKTERRAPFWWTSTSTTPMAMPCACWERPALPAEFSPRVSSTTLAMTWPGGRPAGRVLPRGRPARQRALRRAGRHRRGRRPRRHRRRRRADDMGDGGLLAAPTRPPTHASSS